MPNFDTITGPTAWASYFVNGDASSLTPDDQARADVWRERNGIQSVVSIVEDSERFTRHMALHAPELGCIAGDVCDYVCDVVGDFRGMPAPNDRPLKVWYETSIHGNNVVAESYPDSEPDVLFSIPEGSPLFRRDGTWDADMLRAVIACLQQELRVPNPPAE